LKVSVLFQYWNLANDALGATFFACQHSWHGIELTKVFVLRMDLTFGSGSRCSDAFSYR
jgi:hypothetical protein